MRHKTKNNSKTSHQIAATDDEANWLKNQNVVPYHESESYVGTLIRNDIKQLFKLLNNDENPKSSEHTSHISALIHRLELKLVNEPNIYLAFRLLFMSVINTHIEKYPIVHEALLDNKLIILYEQKLEHYTQKSYTTFKAWLQDINNYYLYQLRQN